MAFLQNKYRSIAVAMVLVFTMMAGSTFAQTKDRTAPVRKPFQARVSVSPLGNGFQTAFLEIPEGKRFVIENVSVVTRSPIGMRMEVNFFTYIDRNGDEVGDIADITFHRIVMIEQGLFDTVQLAAANHDVLVFADERIGANRYGVAAQARLNGLAPPNAFTQAQFTFSGYLEDLPAVQ